MKYNIFFDLSSLFFLTIVFWRFSSKRQLPLASNRSFKLLLYCGEADIILDILGCLCVNYGAYVPKTISIIINGLYYVIQVGFPSALAFYVIALIYQSSTFSKKKYPLLAMPLFVLEAILVIYIPFGWVYSIDDSGNLISGPFSWITYLSAGIYLIIGTVLSNKYKELLSKETRRSFLMCICLLTLSMVMQFVFPTVMLTGIAMAASFVIMFFVIQNPDSLVDPSSGVFNYNAFLTIAGNMFRRKDHTRVVVVGVHGLERARTIYGTKEADKIAASIANFLNEQKKITICRLDNTHFAMLTYDMTAYLDFIERVSERKNAEWPVLGGKESFNIQFTVCHIRHAELLETPEMLLDVINRATEKQDASPDSEFVFEVDEKVRNELKRLSLVENAVTAHLADQSGFYMEYQPIFDLVDQRFVGAEALLRFDCPELGKVSPAEFIPIVEQCGYSSQVDKMVVEKVFSDIQAGYFDGLNYKRVHINLSAASFATGNMTSVFLQLAEKYNINPDFIGLEITEDIASASNKDFKECMDLLKQHGFVFALDDFGTGFSNIARIMQLPFFVIKLDRSLLVETKKAYAEIALMLQHLDLDIITEGVETEEQLQLAKDSGIRYIQGWYFSKSVPVEKLKEL